MQVTFDQVREFFKGKTVAIVGSGPGVLDNPPSKVDSHDVVVRVSNYKTGPQAGFRTDIHYSFYGTSIHKSGYELLRDGCKLCMCKLPNSQPIDSEWHRKRGKMVGIDYRYIYRNRRDWWPCDVFIPDDARFLAKFELLGKHQPTTGFSAILDVLDCQPAMIYLTGFDFFASGVHNVNETWKPGDPTDPIRHRPDLEARWISENSYRFHFDNQLRKIIEA